MILRQRARNDETVDLLVVLHEEESNVSTSHDMLSLTCTHVQMQVAGGHLCSYTEGASA